MEDYKKENGKWLLIAPISGLQISKDLGSEITINKVTFVSKDKLPRIRKRLELPIRLSNLKKQGRLDNFFDSSETFAIIKDWGIGTNKEEEFLSLVRKEITIIALSQLGYGRRKSNSLISLSDENKTGHLQYFITNTSNGNWGKPSLVKGKFRHLLLDKRWKEFHKKSFIFELINVIQGKHNLDKNWKNEIITAANLAGQSQQSDDLVYAFLWNVIAIETLLTKQKDTLSRELPKRTEAFIGWTSDWRIENYENKIKEMYKKRCAFVHEGISDKIEASDILFTDNLLLNIFKNILLHLDIFKSKADLISFSNKVQAEHLLGIKPHIRPSSLSYTKMHFTKKDYDGI